MIQKQKVRLTDLLRKKIKDLRKSNNKRGDILSKELDRGASYISQLENGKIKDIEFDLLNLMFQYIVGMSGNQYNDYMRKYIDDIILEMPSKESLYRENWIHIFIMQVFQYDIPNTILTIINEKLGKLNLTPEQLVQKINKNPFATNWIDVKREPNKLYVSIGSERYDAYMIWSDITYSLPEDYISNILTQKLTTSSYIIMYGILHILYYIETNSGSDSIDKTEKVLFDNNFFNPVEIYENFHKLSHRQQPLNVSIENKDNPFTFYDNAIVNYNEKYNTLKKEVFEKLEYGFERYREEHTAYACEALEKIITNMDNDLGLIIAILASPINNIPYDSKSIFFKKYKDLLQKYSNFKE